MNNHQKTEAIFIKGASRGIILHGLTASPDDFRHFADKFSDQRYSVSVPLLAGHGTHVSDLQKTSWNDWFNDVKKAFFDMQKICKKIVVIGQSMGGTLALHLASHYPLDGLVLLAPGLFFKDRKSTFLPLVSIVKKFLTKADGPDIKNKISQKKAISYLQIPVHAVQETAELFIHVRQDLAEVTCPVLIFHSVNDHVIDYKSSEYIYKHISSRDKQLVTLSDSYHVLSLDNEKNIILNEIIQFLKHLFS